MESGNSRRQEMVSLAVVNLIYTYLLCETELDICVLCYCCATEQTLPKNIYAIFVKQTYAEGVLLSKPAYKRARQYFAIQSRARSAFIWPH